MTIKKELNELSFTFEFVRMVDTERSYLIIGQEDTKAVFTGKQAENMATRLNNFMIDLIDDELKTEA